METISYATSFIKGGLKYKSTSLAPRNPVPLITNWFVAVVKTISKFSSTVGVAKTWATTTGSPPANKFFVGFVANATLLKISATGGVRPSKFTHLYIIL